MSDALKTISSYESRDSASGSQWDPGIRPDHSLTDAAEKLKSWGGLLVLFLVFLEFFSPMLFQGKTIFFRDFTVITYPIKSFLAQAFHQGVIPYWTPSIYSGTPFMGALHPGVFYPPSVLFFLENTTTALNLFYLFHFLIMAVGLFYLVRSWGLSVTAALAASTTSMLGGFFLASTLLSNFFLSAVWLPVIFLMYQKYILEGKTRYFVGAVFALACQTLGACPEICIMTTLLLGVYAWVVIPRGDALPGLGKRALVLSLIVALALGLSALQLVPTYKMIELSERSSGFPWEVHSVWSLEPGKLSTFLLPPNYEGYLDGDMSRYAISGFLQSVYLGLFCAVFLGLAFLFRRQKPIRFWLLVFFLGLFMAFGKNNPVYEFFYPWIPIINKFRYPEKYFYISAFAGLFLLAYGLDALMEATRRRKVHLMPVLAWVLVLAGGTAAIARFNDDVHPEMTLLLLLLFAVSYTMLYFGKMREPLFRGLFLLMLLFDLTVKDFRLIPLIDKSFYESEPLLLDQVRANPDPYRLYTGRIAKVPNKFLFPNAPNRLAASYTAKEHIFPYMGMIYGVEYADGMPGLALELTDHWLWNQLMHLSPEERRFRILKRSNVRYWIDEDTPMQYSGNSPLILPDRLKVFEDALPRAFLVPKMQKSRDPHLLNTYYDPEFDPLSTVLLDENDTVEFAESPEFEGQVEEIIYQPNHVSIRTRQKGNGFLVLMDSYFPGWTVKVDGRKGRILRANHFYRAVQLGPGKHTLEFDYFPEGFREGLIISSLALALLAGIALWKPRGSRSRKLPITL